MFPVRSTNDDDVPFFVEPLSLLFLHLQVHAEIILEPHRHPFQKNIAEYHLKILNRTIYVVTTIVQSHFSNPNIYMVIVGI